MIADLWRVAQWEEGSCQWLVVSGQLKKGMVDFVIHVGYCCFAGRERLIECGGQGMPDYDDVHGQAAALPTKVLCRRNRMSPSSQKIINRLLASDEPSVRWKVRVKVLGEDPHLGSIGRLQEEVRTSHRVKALLSERTTEGKIPFHPYGKWYGAHWVLAILADIGYPSGDESLRPLAEQVLQCWLSPRHLKSIPVTEGRVRRHASQESNAIYALLTLGLADERVDTLADNLLKSQWPDGGWNCAKKPGAINSSFHETVIGVRALALHGRVRRSQRSLEAARHAGEIFLKRKLFRRQRDGAVMNKSFVKLHYPCYWHYDILFGLKVIAEAGLISDVRCGEALDLLESNRLPDGGFPAEDKYYHLTDKRMKSGHRLAGRSLVDWGGSGKKHMNEWVTCDALSVLAAAARIQWS